MGGMNNWGWVMRYIKVLGLSILCLLLLSACLGGNQSPSASSSSNLVNKHVVKSSANLDGSTSQFPETVQNISVSVYNSESAGGPGVAGAVVYLNGMPLAVDPTVGYNSLASTPISSGFTISPTTADGMMFTVDPYNVYSAGMGYLSGGTTYTGWSTYPARFMRDLNNTQQTQILSPLVFNLGYATESGEPVPPNQLYLVTKDESNYLNLFKADDSNWAIGSRWLPLTHSLQYQSESNTAPLAVYKAQRSGTIFVYTAGEFHGQYTLLCWNSGSAATALTGSCSSNESSNLPNNSNIVSLVIDKDVLFVLFANGQLYASNNLSTNASRLIFANTNVDVSSGGTLSALCAPDSNQANPYGTSIIPSNIMAALQYSNSYQLPGVYLCGVNHNNNQEFIYEVLAPINAEPSYTDYPIPQATTLTGIDSDILGNVYAIMKCTPNTNQTVYDIGQLMPTISRSWISTLGTCVSTSGKSSVRYPLSTSLPISSIANDGDYEYANVFDPTNKNSYTLATPQSSFGSMTSQWVSIGSNFVIQTPNLPVTASYTGLPNWFINGNSGQQVYPAGLVIALDSLGANAWIYFKHNTPYYAFVSSVGTELSIIGQSVKQYLLATTSSFVLDNSGYVYQNNQNNSAVNGITSSWQTIYDPMFMQSPYSSNNFGIPQKINSVYVNANGDNIKNSLDELFMLTTVTSGTNSKNYLIYQGVYRYEFNNALVNAPQIINPIDFNIANTDPNYNDIDHSVLNVLDITGAIYQTRLSSNSALYPLADGVFTQITPTESQNIESTAQLYLNCADKSIPPPLVSHKEQAKKTVITTQPDGIIESDAVATIPEYSTTRFVINFINNNLTSITVNNTIGISNGLINVLIITVDGKQFLIVIKKTEELFNSTDVDFYAFSISALVQSGVFSSNNISIADLWSQNGALLLQLHTPYVRSPIILDVPGTARVPWIEIPFEFDDATSIPQMAEFMMLVYQSSVANSLHINIRLTIKQLKAIFRVWQEYENSINMTNVPPPPPPPRGNGGGGACSLAPPENTSS